jgi:glycolate oxidase
LLTQIIGVRDEYHKRMIMEILEDLKLIVGNRVSVSPAELYCYSSDASSVEGKPDYVIRPLNVEEVLRVLQCADRYRIPVTARGAGTGLAGGAVPLLGGIVLDMSGMNKVVEIDIDNLQIHVEPGIVHEKLNQVLKPFGFFFPPDPGSSAMCTIGGMISNNSSGMRSVKYGTTRSYILDLEVVLADGRVINTGSKTLKSAAGYDLTRIFVGAEGTLGVVTKARLKIAPLPEHRKLVIASFNSAESAGRAVVKTFSSGLVPSACEILDRTTIQVLKQCDSSLPLPKCGDVIIMETDGSKTTVGESAQKIMNICIETAQSVRVVSGTDEMEEIWAARRLVGASVTRLNPSMSRVYLGEDIGVPMKQIPAMIRKVEEISERLGLQAMKFGHIGDGNLHVALFIDVLDEDYWDRARCAADQIHRAGIELGGTISSEHGIGAVRAQYMIDQWGGALDVMRAIKRALDPKGILNPGKMGL